MYSVMNHASLSGILMDESEFGECQEIVTCLPLVTVKGILVHQHTKTFWTIVSFHLCLGRTFFCSSMTETQSKVHKGMVG